ncbi:hypothetical protein B0O99DRAFT_680325 [Bisporella sp. PMI_857]|nr:hypothetical protein B0O99DRAFT_680325 [Bisporella sp. PMI_857]
MKLVQEIIAGVIQKPLYPTGEHISTVLPRMLVANIVGLEEQAGGSTDGFIARLRDIKLYYQHFKNFLQDPLERNQKPVQFLETDACMISMVIGAQRLIITKDGYIGFGPEGMQEDDQIVVFDGSGMSFVLRPAEASSIERGSVGEVSEGSEEWEIISKCYLHGWMNNGDLEA